MSLTHWSTVLNFLNFLNSLSPCRVASSIFPMNSNLHLLPSRSRVTPPGRIFTPILTAPQLTTTRLVLETLEPVSGDRKCFRMINGVLVERTVKDVVPALKTNADGLKKVLDDLVKQYKTKQEELEKWKVTLDIPPHLRTLKINQKYRKRTTFRLCSPSAGLWTRDGGPVWRGYAMILLQYIRTQHLVPGSRYILSSRVSCLCLTCRCYDATLPCGSIFGTRRTRSRCTKLKDLKARGLNLLGIRQIL